MNVSDLPTATDYERVAIGLDGHLDTWTVDDLAALLHQCRDARRALTDLEHLVEDTLASKLTDKRTELDGMVLEMRGGNVRKKWDSERLLSEVLRRGIDPDGTGVLPEPAELLERARSVVARCVPVTPSLGWRVGALRDLGLDPDEWCETTPGRKSVQIHAGKEQAA